jgi:hypothetical protein
VNGKKEGSGKWVGSTKKSYDGLWFNDLRWGKGKLLFPNGDVNYDGDWMQDRVRFLSLNVIFITYGCPLRFVVSSPILYWNLCIK